MTESLDNPVQPAAGQINYVRVYTDSDNVSRFEDLGYPLAAVAFAPPAPPLWMTSPMAADHVLLLHAPAGWEDLAHPSPARQMVFVLSGEGIAVAGDEERRVRAGDCYLLEDTTGPGHGLRALTDLLFAVVRLGENSA